MNTIIQLYSKSVYGNEVVYAREPYDKILFALTHRKTLSARDLAALRQLGIEFQYNEFDETVAKTVEWANKSIQKEVDELVYFD